MYGIVNIFRVEEVHNFATLPFNKGSIYSTSDKVHRSYSFDLGLNVKISIISD